MTDPIFKSYLEISWNPPQYMPDILTIVIYALPIRMLRSLLIGEILLLILGVSSRVSATVWLHHLNSNETIGKKARCELHLAAVSRFKQILEAVLYKTIV